MTFDVRLAEKSRLAETNFNDLPFGRIFSDHMFRADYNGKDWINTAITPYAALSLEPSAAVIHYGQSIFEGMKAYCSANNEILLFRPLENFKRMNNSAQRLSMPLIPEPIFMDGLKALLKVDSGWVPKGGGKSLYIRPVYFATDAVIGVHPSEYYSFLIITSPTDVYYNKPLKVRIEKTYSRASRSGTGYAKAAGNYAGALYPTQLAKEAGYDQVIWTDAATNTKVEESGTMNLMFVINGVLVTPSLSASKLAGVTRDSVIEIAKYWGYSVEERDVYVAEVVDALKNGSLTEAFGTGTAANIARIALISDDGIDYTVPETNESSFSSKASDFLDKLKTGAVTDPFNWIVRV
ncbi:MAG: branched-chain amino acid aminotransferase [Bacteroidia bacterium]|jgi:branched-chain amino acid aminotransferase